MKNIYLFVGRSGSGKTTVAEYLENKYNFKSVSSYTTRPPRYEGEKGHLFITKEEFDKIEMVAYTLFNNYEYGVSKELINESDLYVIDIAGIKTLKDRYKDKKYISINIRCDDSFIVSNMKARGDSEEKITSRLENDKKMFEEEKEFPFNYIVYNDDTIESLGEKIYNIIQKEEQS